MQLSGVSVTDEAAQQMNSILYIYLFYHFEVLLTGNYCCMHVY